MSNSTKKDDCHDVTIDSTISDIEIERSGSTNNVMIEPSPKSSSELLSSESVISDSDARPSKLIILITLTSSISGFMFGYDTGYISSALVNIGTDLSNKLLSNGEKEFITSATSLGALIGAIIGGILANLIGRKMVLLGSNVIFVIGTIIQLAAHTVWTMIVGRFVLGLGVGIASLISPLMLSELAPSKYRGRLIVTNCMFITGGQLVAYFINWGLTGVNNGWRVSVGLCMVPPIIQFVLFCFLPDTPRFYIMVGRVEEARKVLSKTPAESSWETRTASESFFSVTCLSKQHLHLFIIIHTGKKPAHGSLTHTSMAWRCAIPRGLLSNFAPVPSLGRKQLWGRCLARQHKEVLPGYRTKQSDF